MQTKQVITMEGCVCVCLRERESERAGEQALNSNTVNEEMALLKTTLIEQDLFRQY